MCEDNQTAISDVLLLGFQIPDNFRIILFIILLCIYIIILVGNLLIIVVVLVSDNLRHPMYIFIQNLALTDMLFPSTVVPQLLYIILWDRCKIFITKCIIQLYMYSFFLIVQCLLLTSMSYDRYLAICDPLHYSSLMNINNCYKLVNLAWILAFSLDFSEMISMFQLEFCNSNVIDHFFCDFAFILEISSSDTSIITWEDWFLTTSTILLPFLCVIASYVCILITILRMSSSTGRKKAFSTCSSHLLVVCIYYGTLVALYIVPSGDNSHNTNKFKSLINTMLTPLSNPLIYSLRNKEIMGALQRLISKHIQLKWNLCD